MIYDFKYNKFFLVSLGAIPGALLRWQIDEAFIVNILGCLLIGFINKIYGSKKFKLIFGFGFCGSLTTFSGWIFDLFNLISNGLLIQFFFNLIALIVSGSAAFYIGDMLAKKINRLK
tara:strand:+ start:157 stop:507 length:351 start_codon:yes stop_codon:yes gene_type:complete